MKLEVLFFEQARSRQDSESRITALAEPVIYYLIKILKWNDDLNFDKHCKDIDTWLNQTAFVKVKGKKTPKRRDYYQWMFLDVVQNQDTLSKIIKKILYAYHSLPEARTDQEVYFELERILSELSNDLAKQNLQDIEKYLK